MIETLWFAALLAACARPLPPTPIPELPDDRDHEEAQPYVPPPARFEDVATVEPAVSNERRLGARAELALDVERFVHKALHAKDARARRKPLSFAMELAGSAKRGTDTIPIRVVRTFVAPDKLRLEVTLGANTSVTVGFGGAFGWQRAPDDGGAIRITQLDRSERAAIAGEIWRDPESIMQRVVDGKIRVARSEMLGGRRHEVVVVRQPSGGGVTLYVDASTFLLSRMTFEDRGELQTADFGDYRLVGEVQIAHRRTTTSRDGTTNLVVERVEIDPVVDPALFAKP